MPAIEPLPGIPGDIGSFHISDTDLTEGMSDQQRSASTGIEATKGAFHKSLRAMQAPAAEAQKIGELGLLMGRNKHYLQNVEPIAAALADGLSLEGAEEALSIGAAAAYISTSYGNAMDSHLHTGTSSRRYLLDQPGVSLEHKLLASTKGSRKNNFTFCTPRCDPDEPSLPLFGVMTVINIKQPAVPVTSCFCRCIESGLELVLWV